MQILRVLKTPYELFDATDVVRLAKSSVRNMAALGFATRMIAGDGSATVDAPVFVGSSFEPTATGADALVSLKAGIAFLYDTTEADAWLGEVEVVFSDEVDTIALATNVDGSGDDRIDVISLRPLEVEEDSQTRWFKDPVTLTKSQVASPQRVRLDYEIVVTAGTVAPAPVAPSTPAGTYKVAEVLRVNGQANVNPSDVTDARSLDRVRAGIVEAFSGLVTRAGALYFGDPDGDHYRIERDSDTSPTHLRVRNQAGADMPMQAGNFRVSGIAKRVETNDFRAHTNTGTDGIFNFYDDDASAYGVLAAKNTPLAWASFLFTGGTWVLQSGYNLGGTVTDAGGLGSFNVQFDVDILDNAGAAYATFFGAGGGALHVEAGVVDFAGTNRLVINTYTMAGVLADPTTGDRAHVMCMALPVP
jgi:hypothetical protein